MLFLTAAPDATMYAFDPITEPYSYKVISILYRVFRKRIHVVKVCMHVCQLSP